MLSTRDLQAGRRGGERLSGQGGPFSEGDTSAELSDSQVTAPCGGRSRAEPWGEERSPGVQEQRLGLEGCGAVATGDRGGGGGQALTMLWSLEGVHKAISCSCWQVVFTEICLVVKKMTTNLSWDNRACTESARHGQGSEGSLAESCGHGHFLGDSSDECFSFLTGKTTGIPIHVFGTETHMTAIVGMALGHRPIPNQPPTAAHTANFLLNASGSTSVGSSLPLLQSPQSHLCRPSYPIPSGAQSPPFGDLGEVQGEGCMWLVSVSLLVFFLP